MIVAHPRRQPSTYTRILPEDGTDILPEDGTRILPEDGTDILPKDRDRDGTRIFFPASLRTAPAFCLINVTRHLLTPRRRRLPQMLTPRRRRTAYVNYMDAAAAP